MTEPDDKKDLASKRGSLKFDRLLCRMQADFRGAVSGSSIEL